MLELEYYEGQEAVEFLIKRFTRAAPDEACAITLYSPEGEVVSKDTDAVVRLAGFDNEARKKQGGLSALAGHDGSYYRYGNSAPDHCIFIKSGGRSRSYVVDGARVEVTGLGESEISITSDSWDGVSRIDIRFFRIISGEPALSMLTQDITNRIAEGLIAAHIGKWSTTKPIDRKLSLAQGELKAIGRSLADPNPEALKTMSMSEELLSIEVILNDPESQVDHTLLPETKGAASPNYFGEVCVLINVPGREFNTEQYVSTYVFLLGTPYSVPLNLLICRNNLKDDPWPDAAG